MDVKASQIQGFTVSGLTVRTRNADELKAETAKIGALWGQFFTEDLYEQIPFKQPGSPAFGVYSGYESDATGYFDVSAGVATTAPAPGYASVQVAGGRYQVFEVKGPMPDAIIEAWGRVWAWFAEPNAPQRAFATDFERYLGPDSAEICIGVI